MDIVLNINTLTFPFVIYLNFAIKLTFENVLGNSLNALLYQQVNPSNLSFFEHSSLYTEPISSCYSDHIRTYTCLLYTSRCV